MSFFGSAAAKPAEVKDIEVADPPTDSMSSVGWSSAGDYLAAGSWDGNVCYMILVWESTIYEMCL